MSLVKYGIRLSRNLQHINFFEKERFLPVTNFVADKSIFFIFYILFDSVAGSDQVVFFTETD